MLAEVGMQHRGKHDAFLNYLKYVAAIKFEINLCVLKQTNTWEQYNVSLLTF